MGKIDKNQLINKAKELLLPNDVAIGANLNINGKEYELTSFETEFIQPEDYKGQPQHEVKGGLISLTLSQMADEMINTWMFQKNVSYNGIIDVAPLSKFSNSPLKIEFVKGCCISYNKMIASNVGIQIQLVISAQSIKINGIEHTNNPNLTTV